MKTTMKYTLSLALATALGLTGPSLAQSSSSAPASSNSGHSCTTTGQMVGAATLQAATKVTIIAVKDCTGLTLANDPDAVATLGANQSVQAALKTAGNTNNEIIGYAMDGSTIDVYVKSK